MMDEQAIQEIELSTEEAKKMIALGKALERLQANSDFKEIFLEGYFKDHAVMLVHGKSDPQMQTPERQKSIDTDICAIGSLHQYLNIIKLRANQAEYTLEESDNELDRIYSEAQAS